MTSGANLPARLEPVIAELQIASDYARDTDSCPWDFAVAVNCLLRAGATATDLRWLVKKSIVEHAKEVTVEGDDGRAFRSTGNLTFSERSCFILKNAVIGRAPKKPEVTIFGGLNGHQDTIHADVSVRPEWDADMRKLIFEGRLIKRFKWPAINQETVLCAFQEEGWPERIDDPLPPQPEQDPRRRLADTIKCLNRKQVHRLLCFRGDGTGEGITWELTSART